uniref:Uncharacterized protein n=1 Tax=viral metagenome TaxID=1070528 RepID=A0A6C0LPW1_9ZZZZ
MGNNLITNYFCQKNNIINMNDGLKKIHVFKFSRKQKPQIINLSNNRMNSFVYASNNSRMHNILNTHSYK